MFLTPTAVVVSLIVWPAFVVITALIARRRGRRAWLWCLFALIFIPVPLVLLVQLPRGGKSVNWPSWQSWLVRASVGITLVWFLLIIGDSLDAQSDGNVSYTELLASVCRLSGFEVSKVGRSLRFAPALFFETRPIIFVNSSPFTGIFGFAALGVAMGMLALRRCPVAVPVMGLTCSILGFAYVTLYQASLLVDYAIRENAAGPSFNLPAILAVLVAPMTWLMLMGIAGWLSRARVDAAPIGSARCGLGRSVAAVLISIALLGTVLFEIVSRHGGPGHGLRVRVTDVWFDLISDSDERKRYWVRAFVQKSQSIMPVAPLNSMTTEFGSFSLTPEPELSPELVAMAGYDDYATWLCHDIESDRQWKLHISYFTDADTHESTDSAGYEPIERQSVHLNLPSHAGGPVPVEYFLFTPSGHELHVLRSRIANGQFPETLEDWRRLAKTYAKRPGYICDIELMPLDDKDGFSPEQAEPLLDQLLRVLRELLPSLDNGE